MARNIENAHMNRNQRKFRGTSGTSTNKRQNNAKVDISTEKETQVVKDTVLIDLVTSTTDTPYDVTVPTSVGAADSTTGSDATLSHVKETVADDVKHFPAIPRAIHNDVESKLESKEDQAEAEAEAVVEAEAEVKTTSQTSGASAPASTVLGENEDLRPTMEEKKEAVSCTSLLVVANQKSTYNVIFRQSHETTNVTTGSMPRFVSMAAATNGATLVNTELDQAEGFSSQHDTLEEMPEAFSELKVTMDVEPLCAKTKTGTTVLRVLLSSPDVYCDYTRVFNEDRCDRDGKTDGVWLALLTKASRIPFFIERDQSGSVKSVKLASVDEKDLGVSELKRTISQLLDVPDRCQSQTQASGMQSFENLGNGVQMVTQLTTRADPLAAHAGHHDKRESKQKILHSTVLAPTIAQQNNEKLENVQPLRITASTRDALLQYNFAHQFPEQYIKRTDSTKYPSAKRRAVVRSLATLQLATPNAQATPETTTTLVPKCSLSMFGALHKKGSSLFLEVEQSLTLESQVGMANYEKELNDAKNGIGSKHPPNKHKSPEKFNPTDLASFRASNSKRETEHGVDRFKENALSLVDVKSVAPKEESTIVSATDGMKKGYM